MTETQSPAPTTLPAILRLDAAASGALGVAGVVAAPLLAGLLGPPAPVLIAVGAFLIVFAATLLLLARRPVSRSAGRAVAVVNAVWVVASVLVVVLAGAWFTPVGVAVALLQAAAVAAFAVLQWRAA